MWGREGRRGTPHLDQGEVTLQKAIWDALGWSELDHLHPPCENHSWHLEQVHPGSKHKGPLGDQPGAGTNMSLAPPLPNGGLVSTVSLSPRPTGTVSAVPLGVAVHRWGPAAAAGRFLRPETHPGRSTEEVTVSGEQTGLGS